MVKVFLIHILPNAEEGINPSPQKKGGIAMSGKYAIINLKKMKNKDLAKISEHNRRESPDGIYLNPNIDPERTHLNIRRSDHPEKEELKTLIDRRISEREIQKKKVRKDAVKMISVLVTASPEYMNSLDRDEQIQYFDEAFKFCQRRFGKQNCIEMNIHFDETNPHAHISVVPIIKGKLCAKEVMTMKALYELQEEFPKAMRERGFNVERGEGGDPKERRKHLSEEEYRLKMWNETLKEKEKGLKKFEQRLEDKLNGLEVPRQALQDALGGPELRLEVSEPLFGDKNKVKIDKGGLEKVLDRAEMSNKLLATIGGDRLRLQQQQEELNELREEAAEQKKLADRRAELLRELEDEHRLILRENAEIRDRNIELYIANARLKDYINHKGLSDDFEDWAGALREAQETLEAELELF